MPLVLNRFGLLLVCAFLLLTQPVAASMKDDFRDQTIEAASYFVPFTVKVIEVNGNLLQTEVDAEKGIKPGTRVSVLREGASFKHPVTGESIGKAESFIGTAEVTSVSGASVMLSSKTGILSYR